MEGRHGILKSDFNAQSLRVSAASVRVDDLVAGRDVCLFKADVEGYEPQVLQTAQTLLATRSVPSLQLELTRTRGSPDPTEHDPNPTRNPTPNPGSIALNPARSRTHSRTHSRTRSRTCTRRVSRLARPDVRGDQDAPPARHARLHLQAGAQRRRRRRRREP